MRETIMPHGGKLVNKVLERDDRELAFAKAPRLQRISLKPWEISDLEMIAIGALSPLEGFMKEADYNEVVTRMRLANGLVWSLPVTLSVDKVKADALVLGEDITLTDGNGRILALMKVEEKYTYDKEREAKLVYRTIDQNHPGVARLMSQGEILLGGEIWMVNRPVHSFGQYHLDPVETRKVFAQKGWSTVVGFQTRNPIHRAHEYIQKCALEIVDGLFVNPLVGETKGDDLSAEIRMKSYLAILDKYYPSQRTFLAVFPAAMRYAGPREAIFHALARKNYGCTHFIVGRDHAGVGNYYGTYDAQLIFEQFAPEELGITPLFFEHTFYCKSCGNMASAKTCPHDSSQHLTLSGTKVREMLKKQEMPPVEFTRTEVAQVLMAGITE